MRRLLGFLLPVIAGGLVGCFSFGERAARNLDAGPQTGDRDRTLEYWGKLREILRQETRSNDLREVGAVVKKQAGAIRNLPPENVDAELVATADALVRSQERVLEAGELAGFNPAAIRGAPEILRTYTEAGKQSSAATARLKNLGPTLSARYGVAFPALELSR